MKILLVPDLHLGAGTSIGKDLHNTGLNSRIQDQKDLLDFTYKVANKNNVKKIVVLGDIWQNPKPNPTVVHIFLEWLIKCSKCFDIDIIQGNHDFIRGGSNKISMLDCIDLPNIKGCNIYTEIGSMCEEDFSITYVPFTDRKQLEAKTIDEANEILKNQIKKALGNLDCSYKKICCGHLALEGGMWVGNEISDDSNEIFITKQMMKELGFDYVFMGHIHNPQIINKKNPYMIHVGSLDRTKFSGPDATNKYLTIYDSKDNNIKQIKLPCRNLIDIQVSIPNTEKDETNFVINSINLSEKQLENSIVRIKIEANSPEYKYVDRKLISEFLKDKGVFNISSIIEIKHSEQVLKNDIGIDENISHDNAINIFIDTISGNDDFKKEVKLICKEIIKEVRKQ